jgi:hypothetical protein
MDALTAEAAWRPPPQWWHQPDAAQIRERVRSSLLAQHLTPVRDALFDWRMAGHGCEPGNDCYSDCSETVRGQVAYDLTRLLAEDALALGGP